MKILVTGAYGQLGNELKDLSVNFSDWEFVFTDVDTLDIANEKEVDSFLKKTKPDFVVNCAAYTAVDKAETDHENAERINSDAPGILAKAAENVAAKFIHISTDYVFEGNGYLPLNESDTVNPVGVYGKTKLEGERNCFHSNSETIVIRTSWLYSAYGHNFVKTMLRLGKERNKLNVVFDQIGTPTNAADLAEVIFSIIRMTGENPENFIPGIYHYSNEGVASWYDFALAIFETEGINCKVNPILTAEFPTPAKRPNYSVLDKSKIKNTFGLHIPYWRDSLKVCLKKMQKIS